MTNTSRVQRFAAQSAQAVKEWIGLSDEEKDKLEAYFASVQVVAGVQTSVIRDLLHFSIAAGIKILQPLSRKNRNARIRALEDDDDAWTYGIARENLNMHDPQLRSILRKLQRDADKRRTPERKKQLQRIRARAIGIVQEIEFDEVMDMHSMARVMARGMGKPEDGLEGEEYLDLARIVQSNDNALLDARTKDQVLVKIIADRHLAIMACIYRNKPLATLQARLRRLEDRMIYGEYIDAASRLTDLMIGTEADRSSIDMKSMQKKHGTISAV